MNAAIIGSGSCLGEQLMTNEAVFAETPVKEHFDSTRAGKSFSEFVIEKTGIRQRWYSTRTAEELAADASRKALEDAGIRADELDMIVACTLTPSANIPEPAITIGHLLGKDYGFIPRREDHACASFIYGLDTASQAISLGRAKYVLVVAADKLSDRIDFTDAKSAGLFGDGAAAVILAASEGKGIIASPFLGCGYSPAIYSLHNGCSLQFNPGEPRKGDGLLHLVGGAHILAHASRAMKDAMIYALTQANLSVQDMHIFVPHQANKHIIRKTAEMLGIPPEKTVDIVAEIGNISGASGAYVIDQYRRNRLQGFPFTEGQLMGLTMVGGGYAFGAAVIRW